MPRDYNINISVKGGDRRGAFKGGNLSKSSGTLDSNRENSNNISTRNLSGILSVGLAFNSGQKGNEIIGAATENRLRQRRTNSGMTFAKYAIGIRLNVPLGLTYAVSDIGYRALQQGIRIQKQNRQANYLKKLSGNSSFSGSRYRGDYSWVM